MSRLRIGIFAHSTNPRGGVVHAMQLAEALATLGLDATLLAPSVGGTGFHRPPDCPFVLIPAARISGDLEALVAARRVEIAAFLTSPAAPRLDLLHAQDSISALALGDLVQAGRIEGFLRTVHHLDDFANPRLAAWQDRAVTKARHLFCVSQLWQRALRDRFARHATQVGNGVDTRRFTPEPGARDAALRKRRLPDGGRMILAVGGIERRKNTIAIVRAFLQLLDRGPAGAPAQDLHLVIAGGASLLDHAGPQAQLQAILSASRHAGRIHLAGIIEDAEMPALYRAASVLCFASLQEGFGLCVLEAMACGIAVIAPQGAPFDEYLQPGDAIRVDPCSDGAIAEAMQQALQPGQAALARARGPLRARSFSWRTVAAAHLADYTRLSMELRQHA